MKDQFSGHIVIFLVATLFAYIYTISPSLTKAKVSITGQQVDGASVWVRMKVCPSFWFDDNRRENLELKVLFRSTLAKLLHGQIPTTTPPPPASWRVEAIDLDSEKLIKEDYQADGRCRDISVQLQDHEIDKKPGQELLPTSTLFQDSSTLRIGVRDKQGFISQFDPKSQEWRGAAIDFGRLIAKELGRKVIFTRLKSLDSRFFSLRYGVVDLTISLISHSLEREEIAYLSNPYYSTGLVMGTFTTGEGNPIKSMAELNSNQQTIVAVQGSSGIEFIQTHLPKVNIVTTTTSSEIPSHISHLMADPSRSAIYFITDELIARRWSNSRLVHIDNKRLLTNNDSYVVAIGDATLLPAVNRVIASGAVDSIYVTQR
jgi:ABC-type amino acid transport substrate-binding protein